MNSSSRLSVEPHHTKGIFVNLLLVFLMILAACGLIYIAGMVFSFLVMWYVDATGSTKSERVHLVMIFLGSTCWPLLIRMFVIGMRAIKQERLAQPDEPSPTYAPPPP